MARRRYQKGHVYLDGQNWKGRFRTDEITADGNIRRPRPEIILGSRKEFPTKRLAQREMELRLASINSLNYRPTRVATFAEFIRRWETEVLIYQKPSSRLAIESHLRRHILPRLGSLLLSEFGTENQQRFVNQISQTGACRKTVKNILVTLSSITSRARAWHYDCPKIELDKLSLPQRTARREAQYLEPEAIRRIVELAQQPWRTMFCVLAMTGLRASEMLGLCWGNVDLTSMQLHVRQSAWRGEIQTVKTRASETIVPIPVSLATILAEYHRTWQANPGDLVFSGPDGQPYQRWKVVQGVLWPILDKLGLPRCGLHAFRHGYCTIVLGSSASPVIAQRLMRHADPGFTVRHYGHARQDAVREASERVANILDLDAVGRQQERIN